MAKYKYVLFDADATLLDFKKSEHEAVIDVLNKFELPVSEEIIKKYSSINDEHWKMLERGEIEKNKLYASRWARLCEFYSFDRDFQAMSDFYTETLATKSYLMDGALEICEKLYGKVDLYIVTNGKKSVQDGRFDPSPLAPMFLGVFVSEELGYEKPRIEFFDIVESRIPGFDKSKAIIIGDSLTSDMQGGINAGIATCWFNKDKKPQPVGMKLDYVVNTLSEIESIIL